MSAITAKISSPALATVRITRRPTVRRQSLQVRAVLSSYKGGLLKKVEKTTSSKQGRTLEEWEKSNAYQVVKGEPVVAQMDFILFFSVFGLIFMAPMILPPVFEILKVAGIVDIKQALTGM